MLIPSRASVIVRWFEMPNGLRQSMVASKVAEACVSSITRIRLNLRSPPRSSGLYSIPALNIRAGVVSMVIVIGVVLTP